ncbi:MAG: hypothetical protein DRP56_06230 [Planctomycetota bacterium]|nr:MAG: hypothetical protein DRP56_06230 [Planctomycetota bacterium]
MQVYDIISDLAAALVASSDLSNWAVATYGREHTVYVEYDTRNAPGEDNCPYIALWPVSRVYGRERRDRRTVILAELTVFDADYEVVASGNLYNYLGLSRIGDMYDHMITVVKGTTLSCGSVLDPVEDDFETMDSFPYHQVFVHLGFVQHLCIGTDPLAA